MRPVSDRLEMPDGTVFSVTRSPADPERESLEMEFVLPPGCLAPLPHVHPGGQSELFEVLEGSFELLKGRTWRQLEAGESLSVEPGEIHTFRNRSGATARVRNLHDPGHSFERYIRRLHTIVTEHGITGISPKAAVYLSLLWREHRDTIAPAHLPQRAGMALLATVGRALRLRLPD